MKLYFFCGFEGSSHWSGQENNELEKKKKRQMVFKKNSEETIGCCLGLAV